MNKYFVLLFFTAFCFGQKITVADIQLKIAPGAAEELYYSFAAGDRVLFTVEETTGQTVSEVTVMEYPENFKYREYNVKKEKNREFKPVSNSVYKFRFSNNAKDERTCAVKIQRVPDEKSTRNFNTAVKWISRQDTVYNTFTKDVVKGYDTIYTQKKRKAVVFEKKYEEVVLDKSQRVEAKASLGQTKAGVPFTLPADVISPNETKKVIAWAYWVGVGEESNEFWKQNRTMIVSAVKGATTLFTSPLGGIAAGLATNLVLPVNGEDIAYALTDEAGSKMFFQDKVYSSYDDGKGVAAYKRFIEPAMLKGKYVMLLSNDNYIQAIDVNVKVSAIIEHIRYKDETYTNMDITPRYEKKIVREPQIVNSKIPVPF